MTIANERKFLLWFIGILLSILSFVGALGVSAIMNMSRAINRIELKMVEEAGDKKNLEYRVDLLEKNKRNDRSSPSEKTN